jgi:hypothetical protein
VPNVADVTSRLDGLSLSVLTAGQLATFLITSQDMFGMTSNLQQSKKFEISIMTNRRNLRRHALFLKHTTAFAKFEGHQINNISGLGYISVSILSPGALSSTFYVRDSLSNAVQVPFRLNQADKSCSGCPFCSSNCGFLSESSEAQWNGFLRPTHAGIYEFSTNLTKQDRIQLWLDNMIVIDQWSSLSSLSFKPEWIFETAGKFYEINLAFSRDVTSRRYPLMFVKWALANTTTSSFPSFALHSAVSLSGLPISLIVESANVCSSQSKVLGMSIMTAGSKCTFSLVAKDHFGNVKTHQPFHARLRKHADFNSVDKRVTCVKDYSASTCLSEHIAQAASYEISAQSIVSGGLLVILYSDLSFLEPVFQSIEPVVDFAWLQRIPSALKSPIIFRCVRWQGYLSVPFTDQYSFILPSNCNINMILDDLNLTFEANMDSGLGFRVPPRYLYKDIHYPLDIRCTLVHEPAFLQLRWRSLLYVSEQAVPSEHLLHSGSALSNSPLTLLVRPQGLCASLSSLRGEGLTICTAGKSARFSILARDEYYNDCVGSETFFAVDLAEIHSVTKVFRSFNFSSSDTTNEISVGYTMTVAGSYIVNVFALFHNGITATYYSDSLLSSNKAVGSEVIHSIDWSSIDPLHLDNTAKFSVPVFSARWIGFFKPYDWQQTFHTHIGGDSERVKVWVNDRILLEQWTSLDSLQESRPIQYDKNIAFHEIRVEYTSAFGSRNRALHLDWKPTRIASSVLRPEIPQTNTLFVYKTIDFCRNVNVLDGLYATFYEFPDSTLPVFGTQEDNIDFSDKTLPIRSSEHAEGLVIRWSGFLNPQHMQEYTIYCRVKENDERVRLWIDKQLIIDQWSSLGTLDAPGRINLGNIASIHNQESRHLTGDNARKTYALEVQYRDSGGANGLALEWSSAGAIFVPREVISNKILGLPQAVHCGQNILHVISGPLCNSRSVARGSALTLSTAGVQNTFTLQAKDQYDNPIVISEDYPDVSATFFAASTPIPSPLALESFSALASLNPYGFTTVTKAGNHILSLGSVVMGGLSATYFVYSCDTTVPMKSIKADTILSKEFWNVEDSIEIQDNSCTRDLFLTRWEGYLRPPSSSVFTFIFNTHSLDDRIRLWINDSLIIDHWSNLGIDTLSGMANLSQKLTSFKLLFQHRRTQGNNGLYWGSSDHKSAVIDLSCFGYTSQFRDSPFQHTVVPSNVCASTSKASGVGLTLFTVGMMASFSIYAHDQYRNRKSSGGDTFIVDSRSARTNFLGHGKFSDYGNGTYLISTPAFTLVDSYRLSCSLLLVGGLHATYYADSLKTYPLANAFFNSVTLLRLENSLLATNFLTDDSIVARWSGYLLHEFGSQKFEIYTYYTQLLQAEDRVRLWLDNTLIIDQWTSRSSPTPSGILNLTRDNPYVLIDLLYEHTYGDAFLDLTWQSSVTTQSVIPSSRLFTAYELSGFPLSVTSVAGPYCAAMSTAGGEGLTLADLCASSSFTIMIRDSYQNPIAINVNNIFARVLLNNESAGSDSMSMASKSNYWQVGDEMVLFDTTLNSSIFLDNGRYFVPVQYSVTFTSTIAESHVRVSLVDGPNLAATYYAGTDFNPNQAVVIKFFEEIDFSSSAAAWPAEFLSIPVDLFDGFSIRWTGFIRPSYTGSYAFYFGLGHWTSLDYKNQEVTVTDERVRMWIDNRMIIDQWVSLYSTIPSGPLVMDKIRMYDIRIEYKHYVLASDAFIPKPFAWSFRWAHTSANSNATVVSGNLLFYGNDISGSPFATSFRAPMLAVSGPANGPTSGNTVLYLKGDGFGNAQNCDLAVLVADTYAVSTWLSSTSMTARVPPGLGSEHNISVMAGNLKSQPAPFARFSYDAPTASSVTICNGPVSGNLWILVGGSNLGTFDSTPKVRLGATSCEGTRWISNEQIECKIPAGDGMLRDITITVQCQVDAWGTLSQVFSYDLIEIVTYDVGNLTYIKSNLPSTGSVSISVIGTNLGLENSCPKTRFGGTHCEASDWNADSMVVCKVPAGVETYKVLAVTLPAPPVHRTVSKLRSFSYDQPYLRVLDLSITNVPAVASIMIRIIGGNLGTIGYTPGARPGLTASAIVMWISDSSIYCKVEAGVAVDWNLELSVGRQSGCLSHGFTYDLPAVSSVSVENCPLAGTFFWSVSFQSVATIFGSSFAIADHSPLVRFGGTVCTASLWISDSTVSCHVAAGGFKTRDLILTLGLSASLTRSEAFTYNMHLASVIQTGNSLALGYASLSILGSNFGTYSSTVYAARLGNSVTSATLWVSDTQLKLRSGRSSGTSWWTVITFGVQLDAASRGLATATQMFSFDVPRISVFRRTNIVSTGSLSISIAGVDFASSNFCDGTRMGFSSAESSCGWSSDTAVTCKGASQSSKSSRVFLTVGSLTGTISNILSAERIRLSSLKVVNYAHSGATSITLHGGAMGITRYSGMFRPAQTQSDRTFWESDTSLVATSSAGLPGSTRVALTISSSCASSSSGFSISLLSLSILQFSNHVSTGSAQITIHGASLGVDAVTLVSMLTSSSSEVSLWVQIRQFFVE